MASDAANGAAWRAPPPTPQNIEKFITEARYGKPVVQRMIDGDIGPAPMGGVIHYPYSSAQRLYLDDFRASVSNTLTHPYVTSAVSGSGSVPYHLLSGSAFDDDKMAQLKNWKTEHDREYVPKSVVAAKQIKATGVRSECRVE